MMMKKSGNRALAAIILLIACMGNYWNMPDSHQVRTVAFLTIFAMGALAAVVIREAIGAFRRSIGRG